MIERVIKKEKIPGFLEELMENYDVIAPVRVDEDLFFRIIRPAMMSAWISPIQLFPQRNFSSPAQSRFLNLKKKISSAEMKP